MGKRASKLLVDEVVALCQHECHRGCRRLWCARTLIDLFLAVVSEPLAHSFGESHDETPAPSRDLCRSAVDVWDCQHGRGQLQHQGGDERLDKFEFGREPDDPNRDRSVGKWRCVANSFAAENRADLVNEHSFLCCIGTNDVELGHRGLGGVTRGRVGGPNLSFFDG